MSNETEREAFEAEHKKLHPQVTIRKQNLIGTYTDQYVDHAAFWFQAGAAWQREQLKAGAESLRLTREETIRDEFAGQCLPHLSGWLQPETAAAKAYEYADAMIKARGEK